VILECIGPGMKRKVGKDSAERCVGGCEGWAVILECMEPGIVA
jgi:hypothetical protein